MSQPRVRYVNQQTVRVSNMDMNIASKLDWRTAVDRMAQNLQEMIADSFSYEMIKGEKLLRPNTDRYNRWKMKAGKDPRRGHKDGTLQARLEGKRLFFISAIRVFRGRGTCEIRFSDDRLYATVPHAEWYIHGNDKHSGKVPGKKLTVIARHWVQQAQLPVLAFHAEAMLRRQRAAGRVAAGRIRPSQGLTQRVMGQITRGIRLSPQQQAALDRMLRRTG